MLPAWEGHLLVCHLANAVSGLNHRDREASALAEWVADRENRVARGRRRKPFRQHGMELDPEDGMSHTAAISSSSDRAPATRAPSACTRARSPASDV